MIVNVRGACGAGKSTLVKNVIPKGAAEKMFLPERKKPVGYIMKKQNLFVPGHYEIQNGGLDTIGDLDLAHRLIDEFAAKDFNVLFEGMNQKRDYGWIHKNKGKLVVVFLQPPLKACEKSFAAKGQSRSVDYVGQTWRKAKREITLFREMGVRCEVFHARKDAPAFVKKELGL